MNQSPLYTALRQLINEGRLRGVTPSLTLDGIPLLAAGDDTVDPPSVAWRADGTSEAQSEWGGRQIKGVEEARASLSPELAKTLPQWYVMLSDAENMTEKQVFTAVQNHKEDWMFRAMVGAETRGISNMTEYSPILYRKGTNNPVWTFAYDPQQHDFAPGGSNPGKDIPNHRIVVGPWTVDQIVAWAKNYNAQTVDW